MDGQVVEEVVELRIKKETYHWRQLPEQLSKGKISEYDFNQFRGPKQGEDLQVQCRNSLLLLFEQHFHHQHIFVSPSILCYLLVALQ
ncbi:hypothetical protein FGO68_gene10448 [Halteria grandinella]|uniref:Uncharacterized protein n=1 Tax=Halteria grandinella TaxID=5974 RepID=A0A8J8P3J8_HALGN|nr:hypothetical protein FGO68_gene10448 [Halteria grandinella]